MDSLELLTEDLAHVKKLLSQLEERSERAAKTREELFRRVKQELSVHETIEEEIFYPAVREALRNKDLLDEAAVEHATAKQLIGQIEQSQAGDPLLKAKVKVLGEYVKHHVKEEQNAMFAEVRKTKLDLKALGEQLQARKAELMSSQ